MAPPRRIRVLLDMTGQERPKRTDGTVEREQDPLVDGEIKLELDGLVAFHVRLKQADKAELDQTMDELDECMTKHGIDHGMIGGDDDGA